MIIQRCPHSTNSVKVIFFDETLKRIQVNDKEDNPIIAIKVKTGRQLVTYIIGHYRQLKMLFCKRYIDD